MYIVIRVDEALSRQRPTLVEDIISLLTMLRFLPRNLGFVLVNCTYIIPTYVAKSSKFPLFVFVRKIIYLMITLYCVFFIIKLL